MEKTLTIRDLSVSFQATGGTVRAVRGVDLDLYQGETLAIVGESGSGKSVTVKAIMGIVSSNQTIDSGSICYRFQQDGEWTETELLNLSRNEMRLKINCTHIARVFQDPMTSLDPTMSIGMQLMEGMMHHLHYSKAQARERALELLNMVGITDAEKRMKNYPHQLSGGMRQRVVIAIALSCRPDILICDEPTTALDVTIQAKILELIQEIQKKTGISGGSGQGGGLCGGDVRRPDRGEGHRGGHLLRSQTSLYLGPAVQYAGHLHRRAGPAVYDSRFAAEYGGSSRRGPLCTQESIRTGGGLQSGAAHLPDQSHPLCRDLAAG